MSAMKSMTSGRSRRSWPLAVFLLLSLALVAGCTSDDPNETGLTQVTREIEVVLEPLLLESIDEFRAIPIIDEEVPLSEQQLLYVGSLEGTSSSALMNFAFGSIISEDYPDTLFTEEHVKSVTLRAHVTEATYAADPDLNAVTKGLALKLLAEPFNAADFPGAVPEISPGSLPLSMGVLEGHNVSLDIYEGTFLNWVAEDAVRGLVLEETLVDENNNLIENRTDGLILLGSQEIEFPSQFLDQTTVEDVFLSIFVEFEDDLEIDGVYLYPTEDISTFHELNPVSADVADGFSLRTCLRNYPLLAFDFSELPDNIYVNRAVLSLHSDLESSFGQLESIVVSEFGLDNLPAAGDSLGLLDIEESIYTISGMVNLDPKLNDEMKFNVTTAVHRFINGVYEGRRAFLLTAGEDMFPGYDPTSIDPDFYLTRFNFFGTAAEDSTLRPRLEISYSVVEEFLGGDE